MNEDQKVILAQIEGIKAQLRGPGPYRFKSGAPATKDQLRGLLPSLVRQLVMYDDREWDLKHGRRNDPGGRSRSPAFGVWRRD